METKILKPTNENIILAASLLKQGEVIGVPTETVYGLAGDSGNKSAIEKIFKAKGRPNDNPLICHISNLEMLKRVVKEIPKDAITLAKRFWPGPLTIIMPRGKGVCKESCAGLGSVGVRMPNNIIALKIIELAGLPFSAPSANISGKPSPTTAMDVYEDMKGKIPVIIDGGECEAGVESTVLSLLNNTPIILRPGVITKKDLEKALSKEVKIAKGVIEEISSTQKVLSPGMKYKHYAPKADITILEGNLEEFCEYVKTHSDERTYAMCFDEEKDSIPIPSVSYGKKNDPKTQAHKLFSTLRELDALNAKKVFARCPQKTGVSLAVYNRLIRSAGFKIIDLKNKNKTFC